MGRISSRNTQPELKVRSVLHRMGFRFRLHVKVLPGKPDIVLPKWRTVVLVHGCFWHGHEDCCEGRLPKSNAAYWVPKLAKNRLRDIENLKKLRELGWGCVVIWECQTGSRKKLEECLRELMASAIAPVAFGGEPSRAIDQPRSDDKCQNYPNRSLACSAVLAASTTAFVASGSR
jgi:DNA mismatch endonuclease, patch repair protein